MSEIRKMFKLLLNKKFYDEHKSKLPVHAFDEIGQDLLPVLEEAYKQFDRNLTPNELFMVYVAKHPAITTANKNTVECYLTNVAEEEDVNPDIASLVYGAMWKKEVGRYIAQYGIRLSDGQEEDLEGLNSYIGKVGKDFVPKDFNKPVSTDPVELFERLNQRGKWHINIPTLNQRIKYVSPGQFIIILARPESGKTATIINLMAGKEGFAAQGANVHLLANEEGADVTAGRAMCCYNEVSFTDARSNPSILNTQGWNNIKARLTFVHSPEITLSQLDHYCKTHKPDVLIIDQLDHVMATGNFEKGHERLGAIYRRAREIASKYDCVVIAVSQASAEAEDKSKITFAMAEGSKTSKAATADLIIGVGKVDENSNEEGNEVLRHYHVSKNKISGWKGTITCKLIQDQSRLTA